jgi:hypothetical protein
MYSSADERVATHPPENVTHMRPLEPKPSAAAQPDQEGHEWDHVDFGHTEVVRDRRAC